MNYGPIHRKIFKSWKVFERLFSRAQDLRTKCQVWFSTSHTHVICVMTRLTTRARSCYCCSNDWVTDILPVFAFIFLLSGWIVCTCWPQRRFYAIRERCLLIRLWLLPPSELPLVSCSWVLLRAFDETSSCMPYCFCCFLLALIGGRMTIWIPQRSVKVRSTVDVLF